MTEIVIYGLASCDTCRKARKALPAARFRDIRTEPLSDAERAEFLAVFGDKLVNRASTTWRGLGDAERATDPATLLSRYPALMKRPVIRSGAGVFLGWTPATCGALGLD